MSETSQKQTEADKNNDQQSTGPKTDEGKAVSRYNALKHGLLSKEVLLGGEDEKDLLELGKRLRSELAPANELEQILVDRIVANTWRLRRAMLIETAMIKVDCDGGENDIMPTKRSIGEAFIHDFANSDSYTKFTRYETNIERGIYKALHELQRLQGARNGEKVLPPVAIDLDV